MNNSMIPKILDEKENLRQYKTRGFAQRVGKNLKVARLENRFSLENVECKIGVHKTQISHFEAGRRIPSLIVFQDLCELYNVTPQDILDINIVKIGGKLAADFDLSVNSIENSDNNVSTGVSENTYSTQFA